MEHGCLHLTLLGSSEGVLRALLRELMDAQCMLFAIRCHRRKVVAFVMPGNLLHGLGEQNAQFDSFVDIVAAARFHPLRERLLSACLLGWIRLVGTHVRAYKCVTFFELNLSSLQHKKFFNILCSLIT